MNERINHKNPKSEWFNLFVIEETALPPSKKRKLDLEATVTSYIQFNPLNQTLHQLKSVRMN